MLHIHNGDSTAGTAKKSDLPGQHLAWREALICGPAPDGLSEDEFRRMRAKYLAETYGVGFEETGKQLREQAEALASFNDHEEVILWFEHDLFCQIHLIYLFNWFALQQPGKTRLSLVSINKFPGTEDFRGLGQLSAEQLASLFPQRREITESQLNLGSKAWRAYSGADPRRIEQLLESDTTPLPFLQDALRKHLERFPSLRNGLGRIENAALELIATGSREFNSLFPSFAKTEPAYGLGDAQLFVELKRLAAASEPLLVISNAATASVLDSAALLKSSYQITERGSAVLRGDIDFVRTNRIDLWLGGVHLEGADAAWRWDENSEKLVNQ